MAVAIDEQRASFLAREIFGFEATARALPGEYDDNFHLVAPDGSQRVLKVMHPARERSLIDLQSAALEHMAAKAPDLALPRVRRAIDGATITTVEDAGARRLVWMLTYVPGGRSRRRGRTPRSYWRVWAGCSARWTGPSWTSRIRRPSGRT